PAHAGDPAAGAAPVPPPGADARAIVKAAIDHWRDVSSYAVSELTIHRPDWERRLVVRVWTRGAKESLVRVVAPPREAGNATLVRGAQMWTFNPKVNRVIQIPPSMRGQSWMGSDFSNSDLAKADDLLEQYVHRLLGTERHEGRLVHVVEAVPKEAAPVVWGKEVVKIRDDHVVVEHLFFDQDLRPVKRLTTLEIRPMGGKVVATRQRMERLERPGEWTEVALREARFGLPLAPGTFTESNLRNPRD
ncbi:MAG TPA: outer membrane lipoprotein-sorting protein, partial [Thermodesulfobacteriota bacterium]|nr:outer membrane lipoprotein-sorting protein [Thermodesulfobacteriota bacterium]